MNHVLTTLLIGVVTFIVSFLVGIAYNVPDRPVIKPERPVFKQEGEWMDIRTKEPKRRVKVRETPVKHYATLNPLEVEKYWRLKELEGCAGQWLCFTEGK